MDHSVIYDMTYETQLGKCTSVYMSVCIGV